MKTIRKLSKKAISALLALALAVSCVMFYPSFGAFGVNADAATASSSVITKLKNAKTLSAHQAKNLSLDNSRNKVYYYKINFPSKGEIGFYSNGKSVSSSSKFQFYHSDYSLGSSDTLDKLFKYWWTYDKGTLYIKIDLAKGDNVKGMYYVFKSATGKEYTKTFDLEKGKSYNLSNNFKGSSDTTSKWLSNNSSAVSVTDKGIVNCYKTGTYKIYAHSKNGDYANFTINIKEPSKTTASTTSSTSSSSSTISKDSLDVQHPVLFFDGKISNGNASTTDGGKYIVRTFNGSESDYSLYKKYVDCLASQPNLKQVESYEAKYTKSTFFSSGFNYIGSKSISDKYKVNFTDTYATIMIYGTIEYSKVKFTVYIPESMNITDLGYRYTGKKVDVSDAGKSGTAVIPDFDAYCNNRTTKYDPKITMTTNEYTYSFSPYNERLINDYVNLLQNKYNFSLKDKVQRTSLKIYDYYFNYTGSAKVNNMDANDKVCNLYMKVYMVASSSIEVHITFPEGVSYKDTGDRTSYTLNAPSTSSDSGGGGSDSWTDISTSRNNVRTCSVCRGTGRRMCFSCDGKGYFSASKRRCTSCNGVGTIECWTCGGDGLIGN